MATRNGTTPLVDGQQSYAIVFAPPFSAAPTTFTPRVEMPNSSGEAFFATIDLSTLTASGVTVWLNGIPTAASNGGLISWTAVGDVVSSASTDATTGIGVVQLFHRLGRRCRGGDFTLLSLSEQTDLLEAANKGLQELYDSLPVYFKEKTEGFALPGPLAITGVAVTRFSKEVSADTFSREQLGRTVTLSGDPQWNQITGTNTLLNPYMGQTGTVDGVVYGDAIFSEAYPFDRVIGNPRLANGGGVWIGILEMFRGGNENGWPLVYGQTVGMPAVWWPQTIAASQGARPYVIMRCAPAPDTAYAASVRIGLWPKRITLADYVNNAQLPVPDQFIETSLIPLCLKALQSTPIWVPTDNDKNIREDGTAGAAYAKLQPAQVGAPSNRIYTPVGF